MIWHPVVVGSADSTLDNRKNIGGVRRTNRRREQLLSFIESKSKRDEKIYPWLPKSIEPADVMTSDVTRQKSQFDIWSPLNSTLPCSPLQSRGPGQIVNIICSTPTQQTGNLGPLILSAQGGLPGNNFYDAISELFCNSPRDRPAACLSAVRPSPKVNRKLLFGISKWLVLPFSISLHPSIHLATYHFPD